MDSTALYQVDGGWQASDPSLRMAAFGRTKDEALANLLRLQDLSRELDALIVAEKEQGRGVAFRASLNHSDELFVKECKS